MSIYADEGTAAHWVLEQCLISIYTWGLPTTAAEYIGQNITIQDGKHGDLSPSGADRWMLCAGSRQMERSFKEEVDPKPRTVLFDEEYAQAVQEVLDHVEERVQALSTAFGVPAIVHAERTVDPERFLGTHDCRGTVDITIICGTHIEVIDAKFGSGVPVFPDTKQLDLYLLGVLAEEPARNAKTARLTIAQPRCTKVTPTFRWRDIDDVELWQLPFSEQAREAVDKTKEEPPVLTASVKACQWCKARGVCSVAAEYALGSIGVTLGDGPDLYEQIENFAVLEPYLLTPGQIRALLDGTEILQATLKAVNTFALEAVLAGRAPGEITSAYKVIHGVSRRRWAQDEVETEKRLKRIKFEDKETGKKRGLGKKELTENRLRSPAAIEKLLKAAGIPPKDARFDAFRALVDKPEGALTLVPISDTRPAVQTARSPEKALEGGPDVETPVYTYKYPLESGVGLRDPFDHDGDEEVPNDESST